MAFGSNFKRPAAPPAARASSTQGRSRYAGAQAVAPREPCPHVGAYRFLVADMNDGRTGDTIKIFLEIVNLDEEAQKHHKVGDRVVALFTLKGKPGTLEMGMGRAKCAIMAAAGFDDEIAFDDFDQRSGDFMAAAINGVANAFSENGRPCIGRHVDCLVTNDGSRDEGRDYFRAYAWFPVPDEATEDEPGQPADAPRYPLAGG